MNQYSKFQFAWLIVIVFLIAIAWITIAYISHWGNSPIDKPAFIAFLVLFCGVLLTFYGMTVIINEKQIIIKLGIGLFRKKIDLASVKSAKVITYPVYYGYGIRLIPNGTLFNVSGKHAVELKFKNRKRVLLIGTNDWENLKAAIDTNLKYQSDSFP